MSSRPYIAELDGAPEKYKRLKVDGDGNLAVSVSGTIPITGPINIGSIAGPVALPTDAATETTLQAVATTLAQLLAQVQANGNLLLNQSNDILVNYDYDVLKKGP